MTTMLEEIMKTQDQEFSNADNGLSTKVEAMQLQRMLNQLFNMHLVADGKLGSKNAKSETRFAIHIFQHFAGLPLTGIADQATVKKLKLLLRKQLPKRQRVFVFDKYPSEEFRIQKHHLPKLCRLKNYISRLQKANKIDTVFAVGHTDKTGRDSFNQKLGADRAVDLSRHLRTAWHCDPSKSRSAFDRLYFQRGSLGERHPIPNVPSAKNRRTEFILLKLK